MCVQLLECIKIGASLTLPVLTVCCFLTYSVVCLWSSNLCCPIQTKKNSKKRYKYEVRRLRRQREFKNRKRLGMALLCHPNKDFWKQVQNISKSSKRPTSSASVIDGCSFDADISNAFATKLKALLNADDSYTIKI